MNASHRNHKSLAQRVAAELIAAFPAMDESPLEFINRISGWDREEWDQVLVFDATPVETFDAEAATLIVAKEILA